MNFKNMSLDQIEDEGYRLYHVAGKDAKMWKECTECFLYLMEHEENEMFKAQYANTLGYIYYYGRTNGFEPEYDKAFKYFSIGAEGGFYESVYKLGDMYLNGYYVEKDPQKAVKLYTQVYEDVENQFREEEFDGVFADIALRLGSLYRQGIGCKQDDRKALFIYTMADYAIKERMKQEDFFGNQKVADSITKELTLLQEKLGVDTNKDVISADCPQALPLALANGFAARVSFVRAGDNVDITIERDGGAFGDVWGMPRIPVIFSEYGYIHFFDVFTETACGVSEFELCSSQGGTNSTNAKNKNQDEIEDEFKKGIIYDEGYLIDEIRYDDNSGRCEFCYDGELVAIIKAERFEFALDE